MDEIRTELIQFVHMWNSHTIRRQPNREHVISGQPTVLYHSLDSDLANNFAEKFSPDRFRSCQNLFGQDHKKLDEFLPKETMEICWNIIYSTIGHFPTPKTNTEYPWVDEYKLLRDNLKQYILDRHEPRLSLLDHPTYGRERVAALLHTQGLNLDDLVSISTEENT